MKKLRLLIPILILAGGIYAYLNFSSKDVVEVSPSSLMTQELVQSRIRVQARPITTSHGAPFQFEITMESTQDKEWLQTDLSEAAIIEPHGQDPLLPTSWEVLDDGLYRKVGILTFKSSDSQFETFVLRLFLLTEFEFSWNF